MISAIILAAGRSTRMGQPKMLLPWGKSTVLGRVIEVLQNSKIEDIVAVTGGEHQRVEESITAYGIRIAYNASFANGEMLTSIQVGLKELLSSTEAALICLGDQPQVQERSVRSVYKAFLQSKSNLVIPSYQMRRGHPWLVARALWDELLELNSPQSPRDFMNAHADEIKYVNVDTPSIVADLDTPEDYLKYKP